MFRSLRRLILMLFLLALGAAVAAGFGWRWATGALVMDGPVEFTIPPGSGAYAVGSSAAGAGVPLVPALFAGLARLSGRAAQLKAGTYLAEPGITPWQLLDKIARGAVLQFSLVIPEGWTWRQMRAAMAGNGNLKPTLGEGGAAGLLRAIGATEAHPEGLFFPDTYVFPRGTPDVEIFRRAYRTQQQRLAAAWAARAPGLPLRTPYEALILASIVEKETGRAADRAEVAAVFINRLRRGMPLQTDPTVIYGLGDAFDGNLRKQHLTTDNPYNTYLRPGLPPTPIALPGVASLEAALHPAASDALYFVARGDGSSVFSKNLDDHNRAVNTYQRRRR